jgi:lipopolysaccharide export system ATP-binding protein
VVDIFSYFRRNGAPPPRPAVAGVDAIDLSSIGGEISDTYVDIASVPSPDRKTRGKPPPPSSARRAPDAVPKRPPLADSIPNRSPPPESVPRRPPFPDRGPRDDGASRPQFPESMPRDEQRGRPSFPDNVPRDERRSRPPLPDSVPRNELPSRPPSENFAPPRPRRMDGNGGAPPDRKGVLSVHGVEKTFVGRKVVKGVSLHVRKGEAVGLLGPNGAGKTTVFYMITGLIRADNGRIELDGHNVTPLPMYQRARLGIGYLPQEASIFRGLNVEQNIRAVLEVVEKSAKQRDRRLDELLEEFNITRLRKTPSIALSGGERRRVEIARALATDPSYMLLDEPFAGIDPIAVGDIQTLVRHLTNRGIGVLITDHNVRETLGLTDRAYIIYSGEVLTEGPTADIVNNPDVRRLYLGEQFQL